MLAWHVQQRTWKSRARGIARIAAVQQSFADIWTGFHPRLLDRHDSTDNLAYASDVATAEIDVRQEAMPRSRATLKSLSPQNPYRRPFVIPKSPSMCMAGGPGPRWII